jgi:RNA polymerase sigma-70 factor (ECF subfamily)
MNTKELDELLARTAKGDNAAFEELYICTKRGVFAFLYSYFHNYADTEDAMQTVYLKVKTHIESYRVGTNGRAWILQIAKNHALNEIKKRRQEAPLEEVQNRAIEPQASVGGVTEVMEKTLTEEEQRIVALHVLWNYKHREIAAMEGCPTGTITSKYKRAIEKMRKALKEDAQ